MIKRFRRPAVAMIASSAFLATGAWADLTQSTSIANFADSLFGPGSDAITINPAGDALVNIDTTAIIGSGNVANLTYTLTNGQFASIVPLSSISVTSGVAAFTKTAGGAPGDSSVTFQVNVQTDILVGGDIVFEVPALTNVDLGSPTSAVIAVSTIVPTTTAPNPFPNEIETNDCDGAFDCVVAASSSPYSDFDLGAGGDADVEIDDRTVIDGGGVTIDPDGPGPLGGVESLLLGVHTLNLEAFPPLQRDGDPFSITTGGDGVGTITLTATGNFRSGDIVFIDLDDDQTVGTGESFTISGSIATSPAIPSSAAEGSSFDVYYVPNEVDDLAPEIIPLSAEITYAVATNDTDEADAPDPLASIEYDGIGIEGYAYGVVKAGGADRSFVRITNETSSEASVFFSCTDDAGNNSFGDFGVLPGSETEAYDSNEIGAALGATFTGRGACDILSDENLSVQHKIRTSDVLTDNSVVIGRDIVPD